LIESTPHQRLSIRICWFAFLLVLSAAVLVAPCRLSAQEPAPASQPASAAQAQGQTQNQNQAQDQANPEGAPKEENSEDKFRHSPTIVWASKALRLPVETTARIFEFINFGVIFLAIVIPLYRFLPKFLRNRAVKLREDIESARKVTEDAGARLSAVEAKLASLGEEIARFHAEVEAESLQDQARIQQTLKDESARIVASAEQEIGTAAAQARRTLRHFAADLAIDQAAKQLVLTAETDSALIAEFVSDAAKGGMN
jgi:F-type H+-transporting ATPase subunit b